MTRGKTPKVFFSSYRPPKPPVQSSGQFRQLLIVAVIIVGGYLFARLPIFQIDTIVVEGTDNPEIIARLEELKGSSILSSAIAGKVAEMLQEQSEVLILDCNKGIPDTVRCHVTEREAMFGWQSGGKSFLVDETGTAYKEAALPTGVVPIEDRANLPVELGSTVMSEELVGIYQSISGGLAEKGVILDRFFIRSSPLHPGAVITGRSNGLPFPAKAIEAEFSVNYPVAYQLQLLTSLLDTKSANIASRIDLRTPGYLYYQ